MEIGAMPTVQKPPTPRQRKPVPRFTKLVKYPDGALVLTIRQVLSKNRVQVDAYALAETSADEGRASR
jgi:hypothetical protein